MVSVRVIFWGPFYFYFSHVSYINKTIIPLALVGYEMIIGNSALRASLVIYRVVYTKTNIFI